MNPTLKLNGASLHTYQKIFGHPLSHNLDWQEVRSLLQNLAHVVEKDDGSLKATRNGLIQGFQPPHHGKYLEPDSLMQLRHFLERSETPSAQGDHELHWLVVIDHHDARIYRSELRGAMPAQILQHAPGSHFRHAHNAKDFTRGRDKPDPDSFFGPIASSLKEAREIVLIGSGTGSGSEMEQFRDWLEGHHPDIFRRIVGVLKVDQHHLTEAQILARAREYYATLSAAPL